MVKVVVVVVEFPRFVFYKEIFGHNAMSIETKTRAFVNKSMPEPELHAQSDDWRPFLARPPTLGDERVRGG
jgi:hypothetical protein